MKEHKGCSAEIGSTTLAMKAGSILAKYAIPCEVVKLDGTDRRGCIYGIAFSCGYKSNIKHFLEEAGIHVKTWRDDSDTNIS